MDRCRAAVSKPSLLRALKTPARVIDGALRAGFCLVSIHHAFCDRAACNIYRQLPGGSFVDGDRDPHVNGGQCDVS